MKWIILLLALLATPALAGDKCLVAGPPSSRTTDRNEYWTTIAIAMNVRNDCGRDGRAVAKVQGVDSKGFEVAWTFIDGPVPKGTTKTITGSAIVKTENAPQVVRWQLVEISLHD